MTSSLPISTNRSVLSVLLGDVPRGEFLARHWSGTPLRVAGSPARFPFSASSFERLLERATGATWANFRVRALGDTEMWEREARNGVTHQGTLQVAELGSVLARGATIDVMHVEEVDRDVATFAASLKDELSYPGNLSAHWWVSTGEKGAAEHFDATWTFVIQVQGRKRWRLSPRPVLPAPVATAAYLADGSVRYKGGDHEDWEYAVAAVPDDAFLTWTLDPGDVLFVPAGVVHSTQSIGAERSLALHLHFEPATFLQLLTPVLRKRLEHPHWRQLSPAAADPRDGSLPADVAAGLGARLDELRALLASFTAQDLGAAWQRAVADCGSAPPYPIAPAPTIESRQHLVISGRAPLTCSTNLAPDGGDSLSLYHGVREVCFDGADLIAFGRGLVRNRAGFVAEDAMGWVAGDQLRGWEQTHELLSQLVAAGILEADGAGV